MANLLNTKVKTMKQFSSEIRSLRDLKSKNVCLVCWTAIGQLNKSKKCNIWYEKQRNKIGGIGNLNVNMLNLKKTLY